MSYSEGFKYTRPTEDAYVHFDKSKHAVLAISLVDYGTQFNLCDDSKLNAAIREGRCDGGIYQDMPDAHMGWGDYCESEWYYDTKMYRTEEEWAELEGAMLRRLEREDTEDTGNDDDKEPNEYNR